MVTNVGTYRRNATLKGWRKTLHVPLTASRWNGVSPHHGYLNKREPRVVIRAQVLYKHKICKPIVMELPNPTLAAQMQAAGDKSISVKMVSTSTVMSAVNNAAFNTSTPATAEKDVWKFKDYLSTSAPIHCGTDNKVVGRVYAGVGWDQNQDSLWRARIAKSKVFTGEVKNGKKVYKTYPGGILIHKQGKPTLSFPGRGKHSAKKSSIKWVATEPTADGSTQYADSGVYKPSPKLRTSVFNLKVKLAAKYWKDQSPHEGISNLWDPYIWIHTVPTYKGKACKPITLHLYNPTLYRMDSKASAVPVTS